MSSIELFQFVIAPGLIGGAVNAWLAHTRFFLPRFEKHDGGRRSMDPGCFGDMGIGAVAALLVFCLTSGVLAQRQLFGLCLLCGISGGNFIVSLVQKYNLIESDKKVDFLKDQTKELLNAAKEAKSKQVRKKPPLPCDHPVPARELPKEKDAESP